jgi:hypothetical protein
MINNGQCRTGWVASLHVLAMQVGQRSIFCPITVDVPQVSQQNSEFIHGDRTSTDTRANITVTISPMIFAAATQCS